MGNKEKLPVLIVEKTFAGLEVISDFVQKMCSQTKIGFKKTWELMMAIDEICSNLITCSYDEGDFIKIIWKVDGNNLEIEIEENGSPFNPLENFNEDDNLYGLGPQVIKKMVDEAKYIRKKNLNKIILIKKLRKKRKC